MNKLLVILVKNEERKEAFDFKSVDQWRKNGW